MKTAGSMLLGIILIVGSEHSARSEVTLMPTVGVGIGDNLRPSAVASLRLRESHTPIGMEAFVLAPWGAGATISIDAVRTELLTLKLFDLGIFAPITNNVSATDFHRSFDLVLGTGLVWNPSHTFRGKKLFFTADWKIFFPDPMLIYYYGDFIRPIYKQAFNESFLILGIGWR